MSFFKKKRRAIGKGADEVVSLHKTMEVLNCTPVDYKYTVQYVNFVREAQAKFSKIIDKISVDDFCDSMFDAWIDANVKQMKTSAKEQYTNHMHVIDHHRGILDGELVIAKGHLENLKQDLTALEDEIAGYQELRRAKCIGGNHYA